MNQQPARKPEELSILTIVSFLMAILVLGTAIFWGQVVSWSMEQSAIISSSTGYFATSGRIWFVVQALLIAFIAGVYWAFSKNVLRPIYKSWLLAALVTLPAFGLRFIGPNQDQPGALIQTAIGLIGGGIILFLRRRSLDFSGKRMFTALAVIPFAVWPFLLWGGLGSPVDILLNLTAALAFGLLTASLLPKTTGNFLPDGLGITLLLSILGSAFGYDGGQILLMLILPAFGFAIAALMPSVPAVTLGVGLLTAAPLIFIDPTELSLILGDFFPWVFLIILLVACAGPGLGLLLWALSKWQGRPQTIVIPLIIAVIVWLSGYTLFFFFGQHGFHGDRLFVILNEQADLTPAAQIADTGKRKTYVYETLTGTATRSQLALRQNFDQFRTGYTPYYLVNALEVDDSPLARIILLTRPEVQRVIASPRLRPLPKINQAEQKRMNESVSENPGWNIKMIGADRVWKEFNITGEGIIVGQADSGVDGEHQALAATYRGKNGSDDFNWYDPWNHSVSPVDLGGHGTHTLGTVLGQDGIGVAPGATWIGCVNLARNLGNPAVYLDCMQFLFAPFAQNSEAFKGDPARGAQVLNNSWGCPPIEGCDADALKPAVDALRVAGVFVVASAGNEGPACSTVSSPLALYDSAFSVGAVDADGYITDFSSRGPVTVDGSGRIKPDIVAPGDEIISSWPGGGYGPASGTSMAGPHLVGVVALLWSANPALVGDIERTEEILIQTAQPRYASSDPCSDGSAHNNVFGYGLVDVYAAVQMALEK